MNIRKIKRKKFICYIFEWSDKRFYAELSPWGFHVKYKRG